MPKMSVKCKGGKWALSHNRDRGKKVFEKIFSWMYANVPHLGVKSLLLGTYV